MNKCKFFIVLVFAGLLQLSFTGLYGQALIAYTLNLSEDLTVNADKSQAVWTEGDLRLTISVDIDEYNGAGLAGISHAPNRWGIDLFAGVDDEMNLSFNKPVKIKSLRFRRSRYLDNNDKLEFKINSSVVHTLSGVTSLNPNDYSFNSVIELAANETLVILSKHFTDAANQPFSKQLVVDRMYIDVVPESSYYPIIFGLPVFILVMLRRINGNRP